MSNFLHPVFFGLCCDIFLLDPETVLPLNIKARKVLI